MTSVRGTRTVYRDEERDYEEAPRRSYTTVKRYQVPESIARTVYNDDEETKDKIVIKHKHKHVDEPPPPSRYSHDDDVEYKVTERRWEREPPAPSRVGRDRDEVDYRFVRTERSADPPRRDISYRVIERDSDYERPRSDYNRSEFKVVERDTEVVRAPSPPSPERVREFRFERDREWSRERERPYDLEKYSKSTEYFAQPAPQPIIIREPAQQQAPIIIREARREPQRIIIRREEPQYEFIERKETVTEERDESRSLVKKEEPPAPVPVPIPEPEPEPAKEPEEDYFYERRVIERKRRSDSYDRKTEIKPRDSASNYSSDDSYEYVRRERTVEDDRDPHHKRHLAEGAIAGIGAAEILRHHRKSRGESVGGRLKSGVGGAALGAVGAEAISRVRSMRSMRRDSRSRSRSIGDRHSRRKHRSRSRSREKDRGLGDLTRGQQLGGLAAVAAVAGLAGYALNKRNKNETVVVKDGGHRRSRSRRRRGSVDTYFSDDARGPGSEHRNPEHRNRRIAQAGLASAAAAGILEKVRSRSRGGKARSKSRIRQGVPIAAAGLGGAALAGLYEKNKANKEAKKDAIVEDEMNRGRRRHSRSRSRSRSAPAPYPADDRRSVDGPGLIAYGHDPVYPHDDPRNYYSDDEPGLYRRRGGSADSSPDTRRRRSRSRGRHLAEMGAAAGAAGVAAHEMGKRRERSRVEAERPRRGDDYYQQQQYAQDPYSPPPMVDNGYPPQQPNAGYGQQQYPSSNYFPPPPTGDHAADPYAAQQAYPAYNPADYANQQSHQHPYEHGAYGDSDANLGQPYPNDTFAGDPRYGQQDHNRGRGRPDPENVSAPNDTEPQERESQEADGLSTPRQRSTSRVRFDLDSNIAHSPEASRRKDDAKRGDQSDTENSEDRKHRRRSKRKGKERERDSQRSSREDPDLMNDKYEQQPEESQRHRHRDRDRGDRDRHRDRDRDRNRDRGEGNDSDDTEELPDRFDESGNRKPEDPLAAKINELLGGHGGGGGGGNLLKGLVGGLLGGQGEGGGGGGNEGDDDEGRSRRRRHRGDRR